MIYFFFFFTEKKDRCNNKMNNYKFEITLANAAKRIDDEFDDENLSRNAGEKIIKNKISYYIIGIHDTNAENVKNSLYNLLEFSKNNYFEIFNIYDLNEILGFATYSKWIKNDKNEDPSNPNPKNYANSKFCKTDITEIAHIAAQVLPEILKQPDIANLFVAVGGIQELLDFFPETWMILSAASISMSSKKKRNLIFDKGFYTNFAENLSNCCIVNLPILDFEASCKFAESLVEFELEPFQIRLVTTIFPILYDCEENALRPVFLDAARKLILHIQWFDHYQNENVDQVYNILPFLPTNENQDGKERAMIPLIYKKINVVKHNDKDEAWFENSAKYINEWIYYVGIIHADKAGIHSYNFSDVWKILILILDTNYFRKAILIATKAISLLTKIDTNGFIAYKIYSNLVDLFPKSSTLIKIRFASIISTAFVNSTNEQMIELVNQPNIFDVIFETLFSIDYDNEFISDILHGLYRFVSFCGYYNQALGIFNQIIMTNTELENWLEQLIISPQEPVKVDIINQGKALKDLIQQRVGEYEAAMRQMQFHPG